VPVPTDARPEIVLKRLPEVDPAELVALMNDPRVLRHMPLARGPFGPAECARFVAAKERLWAEHGYGPWAILVDGALAGWGGLQPDGELLVGGERFVRYRLTAGARDRARG
jgi:[ribosomal protein S5]-alanine N-acetyltransferase